MCARKLKITPELIERYNKNCQKYYSESEGQKNKYFQDKSELEKYSKEEKLYIRNQIKEILLLEISSFYKKSDFDNQEFISIKTTTDINKSQIDIKKSFELLKKIHENWENIDNDKKKISYKLKNLIVNKITEYTKQSGIIDQQDIYSSLRRHNNLKRILKDAKGNNIFNNNVKILEIRIEILQAIINKYNHEKNQKDKKDR